jgi:hypothetical protein
MALRRVSAGIIGAVALAAVVTRIALNMAANDHGPLPAAWDLARFYTVWTNLFIGLLGLWIAVTGRVAPRVTGMLLLSILLVGAVYYALLAHLVDFKGLERVVDIVFHAVVPLAFALHWLLLEPKGALRWSALWLWLAYPLVYCLYSLTRGAFEGRYPYFFLDVGELGFAGVAGWMTGLLAAFVLSGAGILLIARVSPR